MPVFFKGKHDQVFKAIFCHPKNNDLLKRLIEDALQKEINIIKIFPPEIIKKNIYVKGKTLDVLIKSEGEIINLEINSSYYANLHRRNASYIFSKYAEEVKVGTSYSKMSNYVQINLTSGLGMCGEVKKEYTLADLKTGDKFVDNLVIIEFNIDKIKYMCYNDDIEEYKFIAALDCDKEELKKLCKGDKSMEKYERQVNELNKDIEFSTFLTEEEDVEKLKNTLLDEAYDEGLEKGTNQGIKQGLKQGLKQGIEQGMTTSKLEIAKKMIEKGIDKKSILEITGLNAKEIEDLL